MMQNSQIQEYYFGGYKLMRILITGGCGFIGSHLIAFHLAKGDQVHIVDNLSAGSLDNIKPFHQNERFQFEEANILTWPNLYKEVQWADRIYHMAAVVGVFKVLAEPVNVVETNITGCERLLHAVLKTGCKARVIIASSSSVYGDSKAVELSEKDNLIVKPIGHSLSCYAVSKIAQETIAHAYFSEHKIPISIIRLFNVIGPRQTGRYGMVVPRFVKQALNNEPITIFGDGTQTRSFCDVRDAVMAINLLAGRPETIGEIINVGNDHELSINELAKLIHQHSNSQSVYQHIPYEQAYGEAFIDTTQRRPCLKKLIKLTDFKHCWSLEQTIDDLILLNQE